ncbi:MAG: redoxin domain-containing protein, partial [Phycisphaerales bacterium]
TVLAISPEKPSETVDLKRQKELGFLFGTDTDNRLAKKLALSFELDSETVEKYKEYGIDLPVSNDSDSWELPIPATYVINTDGTIKYAFVDEDYRKRANYDEVVMVLQKLKMEKKQSTRED